MKPRDAHKQQRDTHHRQAKPPFEIPAICNTLTTKNTSPVHPRTQKSPRQPWRRHRKHKESRSIRSDGAQNTPSFHTRKGTPAVHIYCPTLGLLLFALRASQPARTAQDLGDDVRSGLPKTSAVLSAAVGAAVVGAKPASSSLSIAPAKLPGLRTWKGASKGLEGGRR